MWNEVKSPLHGKYPKFSYVFKKIIFVDIFERMIQFSGLSIRRIPNFGHQVKKFDQNIFSKGLGKNIFFGLFFIIFYRKASLSPKRDLRLHLNMSLNPFTMNLFVWIENNPVKTGKTFRD